MRSKHLEFDVTRPNDVQRELDAMPMMTDAMARRNLLLFAEVLRERGDGVIQVACYPEVAEQLAEMRGRSVVWSALCAEADQHGPFSGHFLRRNDDQAPLNGRQNSCRLLQTIGMR
jgi:hypothetical protein